jgi:cysteine desulfurase family protein (TIGR01976 family)
MESYQARRGEYPALAQGQIHLDGPGGSQVPQMVIDAVAGAFVDAMSNTGWGFPASERSGRTVRAAREAIADLVGGAANGVVFGASMTALTYRVAGAMSKDWRPGDEVVLSTLDHDANVRPWVQAAERSGATVRWAEIDPATCELPAEQYGELIGPRTRLVALAAASNAVGTRPDVERITQIAHAEGALVYLDAVHAAPHVPLDMAALGVDFLACSAYKFFGPHVGCLAAAPETLESLRSDKLAPATDAVPDRFELGTLPFELLAGVTAAVDHLAAFSLGEGSRREQLARTMRGIEGYCDSLFGTLIDGLRGIPGVTVYGSAADRSPTLCFRVDGISTAELAADLRQRDLSLSHGSFYAYELMRRLGLYESGGAVRVGLLHYNAAEDVAALLDGVERIAGARQGRSVAPS